MIKNMISSPFVVVATEHKIKTLPMTRDEGEFVNKYDLKPYLTKRVPQN